MAWISRQSKLICWSNKILEWLHFSLPVCLKRTPSTRLVRAEAVDFPIINLCSCFVKRLYVRSSNAHSNNYVVDCRDGGNQLVIPCFFVTPFHNFIGVQLLLGYLIQYHLIDKGRKLSWEYTKAMITHKVLPLVRHEDWPCSLYQAVNAGFRLRLNQVGSCLASLTLVFAFLYFGLACHRQSTVISGSALL